MHLFFKGFSMSTEQKLPHSTKWCIVWHDLNIKNILMLLKLLCVLLYNFILFNYVQMWIFACLMSSMKIYFLPFITFSSRNLYRIIFPYEGVKANRMAD